MSWTRASSAARQLACPASALLPSLDSPGAAADWGRFCHKWKETGEIPTLPELSEATNKKYQKLMREKVELSGIDRLALWPADGRHEVPMAIYCGPEWVATEVEGVDEDDKWRDRFDPGYSTGTLDYCSDIFGIPWVDDLKTGRLPHSDDPQLMWYALARWLLDGAQAPYVIVTITHWPKYPKDGLPQRYEFRKTREQLRTFQSEMHLGYLRYEKAAEHQLENRLDEWAWSDVGFLWLWSGGGKTPHMYKDQCTWCPSKHACPEHTIIKDKDDDEF